MNQKRYWLRGLLYGFFTPIVLTILGVLILVIPESLMESGTLFQDGIGEMVQVIMLFLIYFSIPAGVVLGIIGTIIGLLYDKNKDQNSAQGLQKYFARYFISILIVVIVIFAIIKIFRIQ